MLVSSYLFYLSFIVVVFVAAVVVYVDGAVVVYIAIGVYV